MLEKKSPETVKAFLDNRVEFFNSTSFIENDPISVPHQFDQLQDIEIAGLWTAVLSWGKRKTIIKKANQLVELMDYAPYDFVVNHCEKDRKRFESFKHRTFQPADALYFLEFFQQYYSANDSMEELFISGDPGDGKGLEWGLHNFHQTFFSLPVAIKRTKKHVPTPIKNSRCKRLNMFLRWMVRKDKKGVDFGCWKRIHPSQLFIPLDLHVERVARNLRLLQRKQTDWKAVIQLTDRLRQFDPADPVKYDFALFGLGVLQFDK